MSSGKEWPVEIALHICAVVAAAVTAFASWRQAKKSLEKAEHEAGPPPLNPAPGKPAESPGPQRKRLRLTAAVGAALRGSHDPKEYENFDAGHFRHVAGLWALIMFAALLGFIAEALDLCVTLKAAGKCPT
jgi:hypothetical protein